MSLNAPQQEAVETTEGPVLVLAGAGAGKTRVVTERLAGLLRRGVKPQHLLAVTFTNKAAREMRDRLRARLRGKADVGELQLSTFHSLCVRLLRRDAGLLGYRPGFAICDTGEQIALLRKASQTIRTAKHLAPEDLLYAVGRYKNRGLDPRQADREATEESERTAVAAYRRYEDALRRANAMDFDDLLLKARQLLRDHPETLDYWRGQFHYLTVDEFQDTNQVQFELLELLARPRNNLCVVGDDDQSIYGWRGAVPGLMLDFSRHFPGARIITLEQNYRSTNTILQAANAVIKNNSQRREKNLWSAAGDGEKIRVRELADGVDEAGWITQDIAERLRDGVKPGEVAILLRTHPQTRPFEDELRAARIPYEVLGGQAFYDRKEARDVVAYLALLAHPHDDNAFRRVIHAPPRGIGDKTLETLEAHAARRRISLSQALAQAEETGDVAGGALRACQTFARQLADWRARLRETADEPGAGPALVKEILSASGYEQEVNGLYANPLEAASRWQMALDVGEALDEFRLPPGEADGLAGRVSAFAQEAMLWSRDDGKKKDTGDAVRLITGHAAKGLEFDVVYVPGLEEGLFPHQRAEEEGTIPEERRLFYVAVTRARKLLTLTHCHERGRGGPGGRGQPRKPSRFLEEIPEELVRRESVYLSSEEWEEMGAAMQARLAQPEA